jgi:hypothetical protein
VLTPHRARIPGNPTSFACALTRTPVEPGAGPARLRRRPCRLVCGLPGAVGLEPRFHGRPPLKPGRGGRVSPVRPTYGALFYCADLSHYPDMFSVSRAGRPVNEKALELLGPAIATRESGFRRAPAHPNGTLARAFGRRHRIATSPDRDSSEPWERKVWCGEWSAYQPNGASLSEDACWRVRSGLVVSAANEGDGFRKERPQAVVWRRAESS